MTKILFVEDNEAYRNNLTEVLKSEGYEVVAVESAIRGIEVFQDYSFDLVLSDLQMEGIDGIRFLKYIKKIAPQIKTVILTGASSGDSEYEALNLNIDEYLGKDSRMDVFLKYIERVLNNVTVENNDEMMLESVSEKLTINVLQRTVYKNNEEISLTDKEFKILCYMLENKGVALKREDFIENIWESRIEEVDPRTVDTHIKSLRKKIKTVSIASIRGYGYKWNEIEK